MPAPLRPHRFSGLVHPDDALHAVQADEFDVISPHKVHVPGIGYVSQWAPTIANHGPTAYDPGSDCGGNFMSSKFQPNNNCYNYGCDIATSSFAQPGRMHGQALHLPVTGDQVRTGAERDGLTWLGTAYPAPGVFQQPGHPVAFVISAADSELEWPGDYHWVRWDDAQGAWSQKDGGDQVTNFDFAGQQIRDPGQANWQVNAGPISGGSKEGVVVYDFFGFMFVPPTGVDII